MNKSLSLPHSKETEMMVIGCMINSINALNFCVDSLDDSDFYYKEHKEIFLAIKQAYQDNVAADIMVICENLSRQKKLSGVGGYSAVVTLSQYAGTGGDFEQYCSIIKEYSTLRRLITCCEAAKITAVEGKTQSDEIIGQLESKLLNLAGAKNEETKVFGKILNGEQSISEKSFMQLVEERQELFRQYGNNIPLINAHSTGYKELDKLIGGLGNTNLIIFAGRPAMGKTGFAVNIAENLAITNKIPVAFFSLEMGADQIVERLVCSRAGVSKQKLNSGTLTGEEYQRLNEVVLGYDQSPLYIEDQSEISINLIKSRARRLKKAHDIKVIMIDYLQLIKSNIKHENKNIEVGYISGELKRLARELNVPIFCLAQLSRKVEARVDNKPLMSDIRDSGSVEQDADQVIFIHREEYYNKLNKPGLATVIVSKNRHGSIGDIDLCFNAPIVRFIDLPPFPQHPTDPNFLAFSPDK